ncbi:hypothetical protein ACFYM0_33760 [Streptomyces sp. NPDC006487]|uniref:hypothetical protein n=1 Tax=Streptomyces sp. NPDC006487 TaxID=3364748 RepID=UPI00368A18F2
MSRYDDGMRSAAVSEDSSEYCAFDSWYQHQHDLFLAHAGSLLDLSAARSIVDEVFAKIHAKWVALPWWGFCALTLIIWLADLRVLPRLLFELHSYEYARHPPPHASSPCGLLRMASPAIPRGPQTELHLDALARSGALTA